MESPQQYGRAPYFYGPEGSLVQVDFALEAVNRGSTTLGIKTSEHAILASQLKPTRPLIDPSEKVFKIDDHLGATGAGYIGDVLKLIQEIRVESQKHRLTFGSPIDVKTASETLSSYLHQYTIYAVRPLGASVILAGADPTGLQLYQVDPSGTFFKGSAFAIGQKSESAIELIQKKYKPNLSLEELVSLANEAIKSATNEDAPIELGVLSKATMRFEKAPLAIVRG
ncbi:MAG: Ntn hydrolase family protein [Nitrososphaerales archaeon]